MNKKRNIFALLAIIFTTQYLSATTIKITNSTDRGLRVFISADPLPTPVIDSIAKRLKEEGGIAEVLSPLNLPIVIALAVPEASRSLIQSIFRKSPEVDIANNKTHNFETIDHIKSIVVKDKDGKLFPFQVDIPFWFKIYSYTITINKNKKDIFNLELKKIE